MNRFSHGASASVPHWGFALQNHSLSPLGKLTSRFIPTRKHDPCPICEDASGRCRTLDGSNLILCMTHAGNFESIPGFQFLGLTKDSLWGKWRPERNRNISEQDRETWRLQQEALRRQHQLKRQRQQAQSMPVEERDRHYRTLLSHLALHPDDRSDLYRRGFSEQQINASGFVSVEKWQSLPKEFPANLPGVISNGHTLNSPGNGYLCPVHDVDERIVGLQLRLRAPEGCGRYRWLSSVTKTNQNGQPPNLPSGELPLAVFRPKTATCKAIALVEGTGPKPFITSERLEIITVGAAGGLFASSSETLRHTLKSLSASLDTNRIHFFPDAGSIQNCNVLRQYTATWSLLEKWGYSVQIGWWGQISKANPDIDELEDLEAIVFLSLQEFLAMAPEAFLPSVQSPSTSRFQIEPDPDEYASVVAYQAELDRAEAVLAREQKQQVCDRYRVETDRMMSSFNSLRIQPTVTMSGHYIPSGSVKLPATSGVVIVDGPMGVGKTSVALKELTEQHRRKFPTAFRCLLTPRNALGRQSAAVLGLPHHTEFKGFGSCSREVTLCPESGWRFPIDQLPSGPPLILIDEASQLLHQVLEGKTSKQNHALILTWIRSLLQWVATQGGWIVLSEDGITNLEIDLISEVSKLPVAEFLKFEQTVTHARAITLFDSSSLTWVEIKRRLNEGENVILASDSAKWLHETREMAIVALGIRPEDIWIIDSESSSEHWVQSLSTNPDQWIAKHRPRILGYSPTFQQGISIADPTEHFQSMAIHLVHLDWRSAKQMPERLRTSAPRFGYVKQRGAHTDEFFSSCRPETIIRSFYRNVDGIEKLTQFAQYAHSKAPTNINGNPIDLVEAIAQLKASQHEPNSDFGFWLRHYARYQARGTYNRLSLRKHLVQVWESRGYTVHTIEGRAAIETKERKHIRAKLEHEEASTFARLDANEMTVAEARSILEELDSAPKQRLIARKRLVQDKLPGVNLDDSEFVLKALIQNNGRFLKTAELLWMAQNPEIAVWLDRWTWINEFSQSARREQFVSYSRLSWRSGQAKLLHDCPLHPFIQGKVEQWDNNSPEAIAVHRWAVLHRRQFYRYLRLNISEDHSPVKTVNKLLRKLGYTIEHRGWKGSRDTRERQYGITNLKDEDRDTILKALEERFLKHLKHREGEITPIRVSPVIATCVDTFPLPTCDHQVLSTEPIELQKPIHFWETAFSSARNEAERQDILREFKGYISAIA